ncbi:MAG: InlB B-repeat-containing protein, partial [Bacillota bacterium]
MKKSIKIVVFILVIIFLLSLMVSCNDDTGNPEAPQVTITLKTDGGSNDNETKKINVNEELPQPQKEGFVFNGWFLDEDRSVPYNNENINSSHSIEGGIAVFAQWDPVDFEIEYIMNGGQNNPSNPDTYTINDDISIHDPIREGYTFEGWYYNKMFTGDEISAIPNGSVGDKILYALWTPYDITYFLNGGTNNPSNVPTYDGTEQVDLNSPTKVGYDFAGWYDNEDFEGDPVAFISEGAARNRDFYARWTLKSYDITYDMDGGENHQDNPIVYNINTDFSLNDPTRNGYDFDGWYDNSSFEGEPITDVEQGSFGDMTLFAKWQVIEYDISYVLYGGENPSNPNSYSIEDT